MNLTAAAVSRRLGMTSLIISTASKVWQVWRWVRGVAGIGNNRMQARIKLQGRAAL